MQKYSKNTKINTTNLEVIDHKVILHHISVIFKVFQQFFVEKLP